MHYSEERLEKIVEYFTITPGDSKAYAILINGHRFRGSSGKIVWSEIRNAKLALNNAISGYVKWIVKKQLIESGVNKEVVTAHSEYKNTYKNFLNWALKTGWIKIVELK